MRRTFRPSRSESILQHFFDSVRDFFRLVHDFLYHLFQLFAGRSINIHFALLGLDEKFRVFQSPRICLPQDLNPFRRDSGSCHHRAPQLAAGQYHLRHSSAHIGCFILIKELVDGRGVG